MSQPTVKRYIFVDYESLKEVTLSKLEKVCSKVFIFISDETESIPLELVMQAQRLGKRVKWVAAEKEAALGFHLHIAFLMGALHQKAPDTVEFAVLSDSLTYDSLVGFMNESGRSCIRVKAKNQADDPADEEELPPESPEDGNRPEPSHKFKAEI